MPCIMPKKYPAAISYFLTQKFSRLFPEFKNRSPTPRTVLGNFYIVQKHLLFKKICLQFINFYATSKFRLQLPNSPPFRSRQSTHNGSKYKYTQFNFLHQIKHQDLFPSENSTLSCTKQKTHHQLTIMQMEHQF